MQLLVLVLLLFGLGVVLFAVQNAQPVDIRFITWQFAAVPLAFVIIGAAVAGALVMLAVGLVKQVGMSLRMWDVQATVKRLENETRAKSTAIEKLESTETELQAELEAARQALEATRAELEAARDELARLAAEPGAGGSGAGGGNRAEATAGQAEAAAAPGPAGTEPPEGSERDG